jgi:hypothetical protein
MGIVRLCLAGVAEAQDGTTGRASTSRGWPCASGVAAVRQGRKMRSRW